MTFNIEGGGGERRVSWKKVVEVIKKGKADIVGIQEIENCETEDLCHRIDMKDLAEYLGMYYYEIPVIYPNICGETGILSKYPILNSLQNSTNSKASKKPKLGVTIDVNGELIEFYCVHFTDFPYQPYQILGIDYGNQIHTQEEEHIIRSAKLARGKGLKNLKKEIVKLPKDRIAIIVGDFNEPSHLDWTLRAQKMGIHPKRIRYPTVKKLETFGFVDTYRTVYPDEIKNPGYTWSAYPEKLTHEDRIDFILTRIPKKHKIIKSHVIGEKQIKPYPSDHRAVVSTIKF
jgi:endonuclease/exonuclease/phosphatase family metal-dependent hydrolase